MSDTRIEWATKSWNPITGCSPISAGCANCYAARMAKRLAGRFGYPPDDPFRVTFHRDRLDEPRQWKKSQRIFVCSMGDLFHEDVDYWKLDDILDSMLRAPWHTYLLLTKRPQNLYRFLDSTSNSQMDFIHARCWVGVTAENQETADERIPILLRIPAAVRFVSIEPILGPVNPTRLDNGGGETYNALTAEVKPRPHEEYKFKTSDTNPLSWVIAGAETGPGARPAETDWFRSLRDQCQESGVPFFLKKVNANGSRELDGKMWEQFPAMECRR